MGKIWQWSHKNKYSYGDIGSDDSNYITSQMQNQHTFSVANDGSNGLDNMKLYPVTVRYVYLRGQ